jgi:ABC-2 type transport system permease protein
MRLGSEIQDYFNIGYYLYPLFIFGCINSFLVCSFLFFISFTTQKKLLVVVGGLLLYVLYMVVLLFSNSPFMAGSIPQSLQAQQISALIDPFGLSAYFFEAKEMTVQQKNTQLISLSGSLLINRISFLILSVAFLALTYRSFSFSQTSHKKLMKKKESVSTSLYHLSKKSTETALYFGKISNFKAALSFTMIDLIYLSKALRL